MNTKHYTNKKTNEVYGYESDEIAKEYNDDYDNLVLMSDALFEEFKNKPLGATWSINGWVVNEEQAQAEQNAIKEAENIAFLSSETRRVNDALAPLDDAIEFEIATDEEIAQHKELRKYRILLSRVPNQKAWPLEVTWPECPEFFKLN